MKRYDAVATRVGRRIELVRTARGLSLTAAARASRLGKGVWSTIETGNCCPTIGTLYKMARGLRVSVHALIPSADPTGTPTGGSGR